MENFSLLFKVISAFNNIVFPHGEQTMYTIISENYNAKCSM